MFRLMSVSAADFGYQVLFANPPVVVDIYADWCDYCMFLARCWNGLRTSTTVP